MVGFTENLKRLRIENGYKTAKSFAAKLDVPYTTYINWENNFREPNYSALIKIADALETSVDALLGHHEGDSYVRKYFALKAKLEKLLEEEKDK